VVQAACMLLVDTVESVCLLLPLRLSRKITCRLPACHLAPPRVRLAAASLAAGLLLARPAASAARPLERPPGRPPRRPGGAAARPLCDAALSLLLSSC
jgi:hypothetical protein